MLARWGLYAQAVRKLTGLAEPQYGPDPLFQLALARALGRMGRKDQAKAALAKIGENMHVRRFVRFATANGRIASYRHGVRIGVLVDIEGYTRLEGGEMYVEPISVTAKGTTGPGFNAISFAAKGDLTKEQALEAAKAGESKLLLVIPAGYGESLDAQKPGEIETYSFMRSFSLIGTRTQIVVQTVLDALNDAQSNDFLRKKLPDLDPKGIKKPVKSRDFVVVQNRVAVSYCLSRVLRYKPSRMTSITPRPIVRGGKR
jgi:hypothetical protein